MKPALALSAALAVSFSFCHPAFADDPSGVTGDFTLISVQGQPAPYAAQISFADDRVTGQGPCNRFFGQLVQDATQLRIENLGSTRMACPDLAGEAEFFALLGKVHQADRPKGELVLLDSKGTAVLHFVSAQP